MIIPPAYGLAQLQNADSHLGVTGTVPLSLRPVSSGYGLFGNNPRGFARSGKAPSIGSFPMREGEQAQPSEISQPGPAMSPLGGSLRQPIDYDLLRSKLLPEEKKPTTLKRIATALVPALMAASGNQAGANAFIGNLAAKKQDDERYRRDVEMRLAQMQYGDYSRQNEADLRAANPFTIGRDRVQFDPRTGQSSVLYDGPQDFEEYAGELGLQPGTPEYFQAVEDYVLKSSGPSAHERDMQLDDYRTDNDVRMEGVRQSNRVGMENLRQRNRLGMEDERQGNRVSLRNMPRPTSAKSASSAGGLLSGKSDIPTLNTPAEAAKLPSGARFRTPDGRIKVVP